MVDKCQQDPTLIGSNDSQTSSAQHSTLPGLWTRLGYRGLRSTCLPSAHGYSHLSPPGTASISRVRPSVSNEKDVGHDRLTNAGEGLGVRGVASQRVYPFLRRGEGLSPSGSRTS